ncbi:MAG TPA: VOC family protein [Xanthobacteraceae bacterium]|jgi:catechol 2,3-dioxygenase-like lactoylglutathione lyase family enzyme
MVPMSSVHPLIQARRIGHATFETPDLDAAIAHLTQVVGLVVAAREKARTYLASKIGMLSVALELGPRPRCTRLAFEVTADTDLGEAGRRLATAGIASERRNDVAPGISEVLSLTDPKGTGIDLFARWSPVAPPTDTAGASVLKLGHVAFMVPDPAETAEFYQNVLGFRVSDWIEDFFVFMRCNADHHAVNFVRGDTARLHHFAFEVKDVAQVQTACDLLGQKRIPIAWGPVRLGPGHNVAIFHRNADDQMVEFYAELDQMKDEALGYWDPRPWHREFPQRPKVWTGPARSIWGPPPTPEFTRGERAKA